MASPLDPPLSSHFLKHQYPEKKVQETESSGESRISQKRANLLCYYTYYTE